MDFVKFDNDKALDFNDYLGWIVIGGIETTYSYYQSIYRSKEIKEFTKQNGIDLYLQFNAPEECFLGTFKALVQIPECGSGVILVSPDTHEYYKFNNEFIINLIKNKIWTIISNT